MKILNSASTLVITLGDTAPVGGYLASQFDEGVRSFRRTTVESDYVDGAYVVTAPRGQHRLSLTVYIEAADVASCRALARALYAAVDDDLWYLDVAGDGVTAVWECQQADEASPPVLYEGGKKRLITLSIPAQPGDGF